jgi:UDP-N-acetylmuramate dehydrogenase
VIPALADLTTLRLGGPPARYVEAADEAAIIASVRAADEPLLVLAGGSNLVVADAGFPGTVVHVTSRGVRWEGSRLEVAAGEPWDPLVARCVGDGLAGFECLSGIPGSVGATPIQNVGAYGQEVSETIVSVRAYDRALDAVLSVSADECGFAYRSSAFKRNPGRWVVLAVTFELERRPDSMPIRYAELARALGVAEGERAPLAAVRDAVLGLRRRKGMVIDPDDPDSVSAGSFFTNPVLSVAAFSELEERAGEAPPRFPQADGRVKTSAAWLIERAGFARGHGDPSTIAISGKHTLALTNRGAGTSAQLVALAREIAGGVRERFGVELVPEPVLAGLEWSGDAAAAEPAAGPARAASGGTGPQSGPRAASGAESAAGPPPARAERQPSR